VHTNGATGQRLIAESERGAGALTSFLPAASPGPLGLFYHVSVSTKGHAHNDENQRATLAMISASNNDKRLIP